MNQALALLAPFAPLDDRAMPRRVAVIGGGRWARVLASVVDGLLPTGAQIVLCSPSQHKALETWVVGRSVQEDRFCVVSSLEQVLALDVKAVIIANAAGDHAATARALLTQGCSVLVEKPLAFLADDATDLFDLAERHDCVLAVGHVFQFARYLIDFAAQAVALGPEKRIRLRWCDPQAEHRHGEKKSYDPATPLVLDVLPHVWSILCLIAGEGECVLRDLSVQRGGAQVNLTVDMNGLACDITIERNASARERLLQIGTKTALDFTEEPGVVTTKGSATNADHKWAERLSPLGLEVSHFFRAVDQGETDHPSHGRGLIDGVALLQVVLPRYLAARDAVLQESLDQETLGPDMMYGVCEMLAMAGRSRAPSDEDITTLWRGLQGQPSPAWVRQIVEPQEA